MNLLLNQQWLKIGDLVFKFSALIFACSFCNIPLILIPQKYYSKQPKILRTISSSSRASSNSVSASSLASTSIASLPLSPASLNVNRSQLEDDNDDFDVSLTLMELYPYLTGEIEEIDWKSGNGDVYNEWLFNQKLFLTMRNTEKVVMLLPEIYDALLNMVVDQSSRSCKFISAVKLFKFLKKNKFIQTEKSRYTVRKLRKPYYAICLNKLERFIESQHYHIQIDPASQINDVEEIKNEEKQQENVKPEITSIPTSINRKRKQPEPDDRIVITIDDENNDDDDDVLLNPALFTRISLEPPSKKLKQ